jgi:hypothetical protein
VPYDIQTSRFMITFTMCFTTWVGDIHKMRGWNLATTSS